ncbi:hypothetical protein CSX00_09185 [Pseudobutyrivibrio ruminis]|uniref:Uncharacterized protein n=1 Tax=Pseudobutyrivibrio ruminis TaxID=46206 RepID=A0A2G3EA92_9FIRM|nr:hypothetical protein [Pseudobutyrivibrio ruminis]PHU40065.1 hypothetical protein CSX00_09185 [Pseudobutyrivibrio ruminis]
MIFDKTVKILKRFSINEIDIKHALLLLLGFNLFNFLIHILASYVCFMTDKLDYFLYFVKIALFIYILFALKKDDNNAFIRERIFVFITIICDCIELFFYMFAVGDWYNYIDDSDSYRAAGLIGIIIVLSFVIKLVLEFLIIYDALSISYKTSQRIKMSKQDKESHIYIKRFCIIYILIFIIAFILFWSKKVFLLYVLLGLVFFKYLFAIFTVRKAGIVFKYAIVDKDVNLEKNNFTLKKCLTLITAVASLGFFVVFLVNFLTFSGDKYYLVDERSSRNGFTIVTDDVCEYCVSNHMPDPFSRSKYGLVNIKTGEDTGPIFDHYLEFDNSENRIAWCSDGYFVDVNGNKVITYSSHVLTKQKSRRQAIVDNIREILTDENHDYYFADIFYYKRINDYNSQLAISDEGTYFVNGMAEFYSQFYDGHGILNDKGNVVAKPIYYYISNSNYEIYEARADEFIDIYNSKGDLIYRSLEYTPTVDIDNKLISIGRDNIIDFDGKIWSSSLYFDIANHCYYSNENEHSYNVVFDKKILFESNTHYSYYQGVYDNDGTLRCLIAADSQLGNEDKYKLLDLKGHSLLPDNYDVIKVLDDSILCKDFNDCIAFADYNGNLTITDYYYSESLKEDDLYMVSKSVDDKTKYNYIDSHGNLLLSEFCENLEIYTPSDVVIVMGKSENSDGVCILHGSVDGREIIANECSLSDSFGVGEIFNWQKKNTAIIWTSSVDSPGQFDLYDIEGNYIDTVDNMDDYINNHEEGNPRDVSTDEIKKLESQYDYVRQYGHVRYYKNNRYREDEFNLIDVYEVSKE